MRERPDWLKKIWKDKRRELLRASNYACVRCGSRNELEIDHIIPVSMGGLELDNDNLQVLCHDCHIQKHHEDGCGHEKKKKYIRKATGGYTTMICYKDTTFCASPECQNKCGRKPPADLKAQAEKWWGGPGAPIAYSYYCGGEPEKKNGR